MDGRSLELKLEILVPKWDLRHQTMATWALNIIDSLVVHFSTGFGTWTAKVRVWSKEIKECSTQS
jgi:hypothetical protein